MSNASPRLRSGSDAKSPPERLHDDGILLGYSLEHERRTAPIGFTYGGGDDDRASGRPSLDAPTLDPILHTGGGHLMTIAPTGGGKGISCIIPSLLRYPGPVIVIDPKGENYAVTADRRRELGQQVVVLDPIGITGAPEPGALNPLDLVDPEEAQSIDDSAALAALLSGGLGVEDPSNLFWYQRGEQLLTGVIQLVALTRKGGDRNLGEVRRILNLPAAEFKQLASTQMANCRDPDVRQVAGTLVNPAEEMIGSILGMSQNSLGFLRGELLHESTDTSSFDLAGVTEGDPLSIYIVIPPDKLESQRNLLRLWIGVLMSALMRRRAPVPHSTLLVLDEAAQLGPLDQLRQAVTLMRGYGLQTWSFWQDVSQLKNLYARDWETMYNNCRVHQAFGFTTLKAAEASCDLLGFHDPLEALKLDFDEMILSVSGDEAVIAQKPNYLTDPAFQGLYAPNPFYTKSRGLPPQPRRPKRVYIRPATESLAERTEREGAGEEDGDDRTRDAAVARTELQALLEDEVDADPGENGSGDGTGGRTRMASPSRLAPLPDVTVENASAVPFVLDLMIDTLGGSWNPITAHIRGISPSFWADLSVVEVADPTQERGRQLVSLHKREVKPFRGDEETILAMNRVVPIELTDENVAEYVRIFFHFARHRDQRVRIVETLDQLRYWVRADRQELNAYDEFLHPIRVVDPREEGGANDGGGWTVEAIELSEGTLSNVGISVAANGDIIRVARGAVVTSLDLPVGYPEIGLDGKPLAPELSRALGETQGWWDVLVEVERRALLDALTPRQRGEIDDEGLMLRRGLRCFPGYDMLRMPSANAGESIFLFERMGVFERVSLGDPLMMHAFALGLHGAAEVPLRLDDTEAAKEYLRLYTWFMRAPDTWAYALLLDRFEEVPLARVAEPDPSVPDRLRAQWIPMTALPLRDDDPDSVAYRFKGSILSRDVVTFVELALHSDGQVDFEDESEFEEQLALDEERLSHYLAMPPLAPADAGARPRGASPDMRENAP